MDIFFYNKDKVVFPGISIHIFTDIENTAESLTNAYGLMLPTVAASYGFMRYLRETGNGKKIDFSINASICLPFLDNEGQLSMYYVDREKQVLVTDLPQATTKKWKVCVFDNFVRSKAIEDAIANMTMTAAVSYINEHVGIRFLKPISVDIKEWVEKRKDKPSATSFTFTSD